MYEFGVVKSIEGVNARVIISRQGSPCEHCTQDACAIPEKGIEIEAINAAGANAGQKVKVVMKSFTFVKGAFLIYVLPVAALFGGAILGKIYLPSVWGGVDSDLLAAIGGFIAFFASLLIIKILSGRIEKKSEHKYVIESVVES